MIKKKLTANKRKRIITVRSYENGKLYDKYKVPATKEQCEDCKYWNEFDIRDFLKHIDWFDAY